MMKQKKTSSQVARTLVRAYCVLHVEKQLMKKKRLAVPVF